MVKTGGTDGVGTPPRYGERRISKELYKKLRSKTPTKELQDKMNEGVILPIDDPVLAGKKVETALEADHIVPMDKIAKMENFDKLTFEQQVKILNNPENFTALSKSANTSKKAKSYEDWTHYKKGKPGEIEVNPDFRKEMIKKEKELERKIQKLIDDLLNTDE
ncbi:GmrSD restriction endonuclease domain-containing protein [Paenibacillus sp. 203]|uniref:GmrSD restriction endonuclease domain-containing protein n=1 Tax=Paenibacillus sp. 203 TaxID=3096765 RepID=UPI00300B07C4